MSALNAALAYADLGLHVIPIEARGKKPISDDWVTRATTDADTIRAWFARGEHNLGIVCGPSRIVVVDIDPRNGGDATYQALVAEFGELPPTPTACTGGGGLHIMLRAPDGADLVGKLGDGVDLLRGGRQFLAAPSIHPSGMPYFWRTGRAPGEIEIAEMPAAWVARATRRAATPPPPRTVDDADRQVRRARAYLAKLPPSVEGQHGSDAMFAAACWLVHGFQLDDADARALLDEYNARAVPPWSERDVERKLGEARARGDASRWQIEDRPLKSAPNALGADFEPANANAPTDPWATALATARAEVQAKLSATTNGTAEPLFDLDAADLLTMEMPSTSWLVQALVTRGGTAMSAGEPKAGIKTWGLIECALAVATGTKAFGEFQAERGRVAFFFAEDQLRSVHNRVRSLLAGAGRTLDRGSLYLQPRGRFIDVLNVEDLAWIIASCRRQGRIDLLVLDPLRDIHSGEEDKSDSMRDVMRALRVLGEILGCTVWVSHHTAKGSKDTAKRRPGQNARGSGAIHGSIDSGFYIEPRDGDGTNVFRAQVTSQIKDARSAGTFDLELAIEDDADGAAVRASWTFARSAPKAESKHSDDDAVFAFVRDLAIRGERRSRTALKLHDERPIGEKRTSASLDRLIESGRLVLVGGKVQPK